jgi:hypothetical protein
MGNIPGTSVPIGAVMAQQAISAQHQADDDARSSALLLLLDDEESLDLIDHDVETESNMQFAILIFQRITRAEHLKYRIEWEGGTFSTTNPEKLDQKKTEVALNLLAKGAPNREIKQKVISIPELRTWRAEWTTSAGTTPIEAPEGLTWDTIPAGWVIAELEARTGEGWRLLHISVDRGLYVGASASFAGYPEAVRYTFGR